MGGGLLKLFWPVTSADFARSIAASHVTANPVSLQIKAIRSTMNHSRSLPVNSTLQVHISPYILALNHAIITAEFAGFENTARALRNMLAMAFTGSHRETAR